MRKVAIIFGSKSDWDKAKPIVDTLEQFGVPYSARILSAHRTPGSRVTPKRTATVP